MRRVRGGEGGRGGRKESTHVEENSGLRMGSPRKARTCEGLGRRRGLSIGSATLVRKRGMPPQYTRLPKASGGQLIPSRALVASTKDGAKKKSGEQKWVEPRCSRPSKKRNRLSNVRLIRAVEKRGVLGGVVGARFGARRGG